MNINTFGFIITGILLNALAQLLLKKGTNAIGEIHVNASNWFHIGVQIATQWPIIGGLACYALSVVVWIIGLSRIPVTIAYPLLSIGYIVNAIGAWYFLGEVMTLQRMLAIGIIIIGVALLMKS